MNSTTLQQIHTLFHSLPPIGEQNNGLRSVLSADVDIVANGRDASLVLDRRTRIGFLFFHMRDKSVNVLDKNMLKTCERLFGTVESLVQNTDIRAVVLFSLKDKGFIAGADIDMLSHIDSEEQGEYAGILTSGGNFLRICYQIANRDNRDDESC